LLRFFAIATVRRSEEFSIATRWYLIESNQTMTMNCSLLLVLLIFTLLVSELRSESVGGDNRRISKSDHSLPFDGTDDDTLEGGMKPSCENWWKKKYGSKKPAPVFQYPGNDSITCVPLEFVSFSQDNIASHTSSGKTLQYWIDKVSEEGAGENKIRARTSSKESLRTPIALHFPFQSPT
jgi:hypothetical protein